MLTRSVKPHLQKWYTCKQCVWCDVVDDKVHKFVVLKIINSSLASLPSSLLAFFSSYLLSIFSVMLSLGGIKSFCRCTFFLLIGLVSVSIRLSLWHDYSIIKGYMEYNETFTKGETTYDLQAIKVWEKYVFGFESVHLTYFTSQFGVQLRVKCCQHLT